MDKHSPEHIADNAADAEDLAEAQDYESSPPKRLSDLLEQLLERAGRRISLGDLAEALNNRSFGAFLVVFALPNLIPLPPGATLILGLPLLFITWQILIGRENIWLPKRIANYSFERSTFATMVTKMGPWLKWSETWVRPRRWPLQSKRAEQLFGVFALFVAIIVVVPIPFGNWLPAFSLAVMGVAHIERDGICLGVGALIGVLSAVVVAIIVLATGVLLSQVF